VVIATRRTSRSNSWRGSGPHARAFPHLARELLHSIATAQACVMMGDFDRAVGYIARALAAVNPPYTPAMFRLDPIWHPLRERADFRRLIGQR
jgi:hypothetical protein